MFYVKHLNQCFQKFYIFIHTQKSKEPCSTLYKSRFAYIYIQSVTLKDEFWELNMVKGERHDFDETFSFFHKRIRL